MQFLTRDLFEYWLANMDDHLAGFIAAQPSDIQTRLDYSIASLDFLEELILSSYPSTESMLLPEHASHVNGCACYLGETFRKAVGGKWDIKFDDRNFAFYGLPILVDGNKQVAPRCPLTLATATADRRTGHFLRSVLVNAITS